MLKKFFVAIIFAALLSVNNCYASFEEVAATTPDSDSWFLALLKNGEEYYFAMVNKKALQGALVPYERDLYNFYLNESPIIFKMYVFESPRDVDADLGEWENKFHTIPVYALFNYSNGRVTLESYLSSGQGLNPSHYQAKIQSPYHIKLAEIFLTHMPELHRVIESKGITLP